MISLFDAGDTTGYYLFISQLSSVVDINPAPSFMIAILIRIKQEALIDQCYRPSSKVIAANRRNKN
jgi:hypothetical protein